MAMISCDMRAGRTDEQKRRLTAGIIKAVSDATGEPWDDIFVVIREGSGIDFVEHGQHLPDYVDGAADDRDLVSRLK